MAEVFDVKIEVNADKVKAELNDALDRALEEIGKQAEGYGKETIRAEGRIRHSTMINSVTHEVSDDTVYVGTNVKYAIYHELGTGIHASNGKGRKTPWYYKDDKGKWHWTRGIKPIHFLSNSIQKHIDEYRRIAEDKLKGK